MLSGFKNLINKPNRKVINQIYTRPEKETKFDSVHNYIFKPNIEHQIDVLYLPKDKKYGYSKLLLLVDVYNSIVDSRGLPDLLNSSIVVALNDIYEKNSLLNYPKMIMGDGEFDNKEIRQWAKTNEIGLRIVPTEHHRGLSSINNVCKTYGRVLWKLQISKEIDSKKTERNWVDNSRKITNILNKHHTDLYKLDKDGIRHDNKYKPFYENETKTKTSKKPIDIIQDGVRVRLALTHPKSFITNKTLQGTFRDTDHRFSKTIFQIVSHYIANSGIVLYKIRNLDSNDIIDHYITRQQLLIV
jgi:hypothetical protein